MMDPSTVDLTDAVRRLRDYRERFIFQGGSPYAMTLADVLDRARDASVRQRGNGRRIRLHRILVMCADILFLALCVIMGFLASDGHLGLGFIFGAVGLGYGAVAYYAGGRDLLDSRPRYGKE